MRPLGSSRRSASLGCCFRGDHPPGPTCRARRRSSASRSGARSGRCRVSQASTVPGSLARMSPVLLPLVAGDRRPEPSSQTIEAWLCDCVRQSADRSAAWRPSARRTGPTRRPPQRRAGGSLPPALHSPGHRAPSKTWCACGAWPADVVTAVTPGRVNKREPDTPRAKWPLSGRTGGARPAGTGSEIWDRERGHENGYPCANAQ